MFYARSVRSEVGPISGVTEGTRGWLISRIEVEKEQDMACHGIGKNTVCLFVTISFTSLSTVCRGCSAPSLISFVLNDVQSQNQTSQNLVIIRLLADFARISASLRGQDQYLQYFPALTQPFSDEFY